MPSRLAGRKLALLLVGAVLTVLAAWVLSDASPSDTVKLPDGRRIKLRAITFGTNHHFSDKVLHRILLPIVSTNIAAKLRLKEAVVPAANDSIVCWVELKSPRTALTSLEVAVADQDGRETVTQKTVAAGTLFGGRFITAHHFMSFPRRSREFFVNVYLLEMAGKKKVAEFKVDNPMRSTRAGWNAEPLPVRRRGKDADFILSEFNTGLYSETAFGEFSRTWTELVIDSVPSAGPWRPLWIRVTDATGNSYEQNNPTQSLSPTNSRTDAVQWPAEHTVISLPCMLWADEPAWKVEVRLAHTRPSVFSPRQMWDIRDLAIPPSNGTTFTNAPAWLGPGNLSLKRSAGTPISLPPSRPSTRMTTVAIGNPEPGPPRIEVRAEPGATITLLKVTDDRSNSVLFTSSPLPAYTKTFTLTNLSPQAVRLNVSLAIHGIETIEFVARPSLLNTNIERQRVPKYFSH